MDIALEMEQWAAGAAHASAALLALFLFPVRHPPYPHCTVMTLSMIQSLHRHFQGHFDIGVAIVLILKSCMRHRPNPD